MHSPCSPSLLYPPDSPSFRRRLVEDYRRAVVLSGREPAYHRFSDRYGGTSGIPYATRSARAASASRGDVLQWCVSAAEASGSPREAQRLLRAALDHLQRDAPNGARAADILRRAAQLSMRQGDDAAALEALDLSVRADPLAPRGYAMRAACHERLGAPATAHAEYVKYLALQPPSVAVLAHAGECALRAGDVDAAERHLRRLLRMKAAPRGFGNLMDTESDPGGLCEAHAYYCLGRALSTRADSESPAACYAMAASNAAYVAAYEDAVEAAMAVRDASLALENLRHLQRLCPGAAAYHTRAADVCAMMGDAAAEAAELARALDQRQSVAERRATLLRRAAVHATKLRRLDHAILDLTLLLGLPGDDGCAARAFLQRAKAFERRAAERANTRREDVAAALLDYDRFVETALRQPADASCAPEAITEAMLILATGAYREKEFHNAARFFARAVARGWGPHERLPQRRQGGLAGAAETTRAEPAPLIGADLLTKMYVAIAHTVIGRYPTTEEMFKITYEPREKREVEKPMESKKSKAAEKKEAEKPAVVVPAIGYQMVEEHYQKLRALEPTVFSALQYELLDLWEPYRTEVERLREDLMLTRSGKKVKRR